MFVGLWGFGWSAQVGDPWIAPTVFFGVIGFGCTLGSTVSISFVVDSYRADAGSSLTSLNFSKNLIGIPLPLPPGQQLQVKWADTVCAQGSFSRWSRIMQ